MATQMPSTSKTCLPYSENLTPLVKNGKMLELVLLLPAAAYAQAEPKVETAGHRAGAEGPRGRRPRSGSWEPGTEAEAEAAAIPI